jgi:transposase
MKHNKFTDQEKEILLKNPCILKIGARNLTYSNEFKLKAIKEHQNGKMPMQIFIDARINVDIIGREKPKWCLKSWNKIVKNQGETALIEEQRGNIGRPRTAKLSTDEQLKKAKAQIAYLKAENDFLKKLKALERGSI